MMTLVTGGSGSGKSEYAERLAAAGGTPRIYVATMIPWDDEGRRRIEKHRAMRAGKGFETVECYTGLERLAVELARRLEEEPRRGEEHSEARAGSILLECVSNLTANEFYSPETPGGRTWPGFWPMRSWRCGLSAGIWSWSRTTCSMTAGTMIRKPCAIWKFWRM